MVLPMPSADEVSAARTNAGLPPTAAAPSVIPVKAARTEPVAAPPSAADLPHSFSVEIGELVTSRGSVSRGALRNALNPDALAIAGKLDGTKPSVKRPLAGMGQKLRQVLPSAWIAAPVFSQILRLCLPGPFDPKSAGPGLLSLLARAADIPDFATLEAHLAETQAKVRASFVRILGKAP